MSTQVFLSYQSDSRSKVEAVRQALEASQIHCWMDRPEIAAGDDWLRRIRDGVEKSQLLVVFLTEKCEDSRYVEQEVLTADAREIPILIVRLEDYMAAREPLSRINRFHFLNAFDGPIEDHIGHIVLTVRQRLSQHSYSTQPNEQKSADILTGSPVADIGRLVNEAWITGFLLPTIKGISIKEGHQEGLDRPYTFFAPDADPKVDSKANAIYSSHDKKPLSYLLEESLGKMMIFGKRGSGKTILMLQLVRDLLPIMGDVNEASAPLYLNVGSWVDPQKPASEQLKIKDWIRSRLVKEYHLHRNRAEALIRSKKLIYCFDGLDDIREDHDGYRDDDGLTNPQSHAFQSELLQEFIRQLGELASDASQQVVITGGEAVRALIMESQLPFYIAEIQPWTEKNLVDYLDERGLGALAVFIKAYPDIQKRLIESFSELQMLGTIYQKEGRAQGLGRNASIGTKEYFSKVYDIYLKIKYESFEGEVRGKGVPTDGPPKDKTARMTKADTLSFSLEDITNFTPSIASYISQPGQGEAFRLDTLQPYDLPKELYGTYRWYAGLLIGSGIALTAGIPVLTCIILEALVHHAPMQVLGLHAGVAVLGYLLAAAITAIGYRVADGWKFGLLVGLTFAIGKGFASGCSLRSPGFPPGLDAGIHNGLIALIGAVPIFAAIMWQTREESYKILPIETWDSDTSKIVYWILGAAGLGALFALGLGWAKGLSFACALGLFAFERFGKKPRLAPVHVRPNQAIIYSFKNAIKSGTIFALLVGVSTGISYTLAYGVPEGPLSGIMATSAFVSVFFFGGLPVAKHFALRNTLKHAGLASGKLGLWLQMAVNIGLMKQVGGGYVFSSEDARREYASRQKSKEPYGVQWGQRS